jgi:hypothetical protein
LAGAFRDAQDWASRTPGCWNSAPPQGDPQLLDRLEELAVVDAGGRERLLVTGGVRQFAALWAGRTRLSVVEQPTFADVPYILGGASEVRLTGWEDLEEEAAHCTEPATFWVTSPLRNPDGRTLSKAEEGLLSRLPPAGHQVVVNQVYRWYAPEACRVPEGAWSLSSLSKLVGGGSRLGWAVGPDPAATMDLARRWRMPGPATVWQRTWARFLSPATVAALLAECVEPVAAARHAFAARAAELLGWECDGPGMSLALTGAEDAEGALLQALARCGVQANPGSAFALPSGVRLAFTGVDTSGAEQCAERIARLLLARPELALTPCAAGLELSIGKGAFG